MITTALLVSQLLLILLVVLQGVRMHYLRDDQRRLVDRLYKRIEQLQESIDRIDDELLGVRLQVAADRARRTRERMAADAVNRDFFTRPGLPLEVRLANIGNQLRTFNDTHSTIH